jgi:hypothetical protein
MEKIDAYTLPIESMLDLVEETEAQISITKELLADLLQRQDVADDHFLLPLVVEILASNYSIHKLIEREIENADICQTKDVSGQDVVLLKEVVNILNALLLGRYQANLELNMLSHSVSTH